MYSSMKYPLLFCHGDFLASMKHLHKPQDLDADKPFLNL